MPKQVRIRRGTTAQHTTFTGADGEITYDTSRKCLVVHDGVTAGGKAVTGYAVLDPGDPLTRQDFLGHMQFRGGDDDIGAAQFTHLIYTAGVWDSVFLRSLRLELDPEVLAYSANIVLNFGTSTRKTITLAGNVAFTTSNLFQFRMAHVRIICDGSLRTLAFPGGWKWLGSAAPANIAANKNGLLQLWSFGTTDADMLAKWDVEP